jgi:cobalt/nickel transport system permease protein
MHIPDGFLDVKTFGTLCGISAVSLGYAVKKVSKRLGDKTIPLLGVTAAFIFAAQMLNFPIAGGTSGHFMGGLLACILLGPFCGLIVMSTVLIVQCLVFQDGGLTALGANIFNMGVAGSLIVYYIYVTLKKVIPDTISCFFIGWLSIVLGASLCALELAISGTVPLKICLFTMVGYHALIGIGEGLITVSVIGFVKKTRPDLLELEKA